jgi:DNA repair protein RadD
MPHELRDYQQEAVNAIWEFCHQNVEGAGYLDCPTGGGKSLIQAASIERILTKYPTTRILCLVHNAELVEQNSEELFELLPNHSYGIYCAGLKKKQMKELTFGSVQSLYRANIPAFDLVFIDEFHMCGANTKMYMMLINKLRAHNPKVKIIGLSATPFRTDSGKISEEGLFTNHIYHVDINRLLKAGYLAPLVTKTTPIDRANFTKVKITRGDYDLQHMESIMLSPKVYIAYMTQIISTFETRNKMLIFGSTLRHAQIMQQTLLENGIDAKYCDGTTPKDERKTIIDEFKAAKKGVLINCGLFTTGFNVRDLDCIALVRATQSPVLYTQVLGRGMRTFVGKVNCLLLDYGGNIDRFGPIDTLTIEPKSKKDKKAEISAKQVKMCTGCGFYSPMAAIECGDCGIPFPVKVIDNSKFSMGASDSDIISQYKKPEWYDITDMSVGLHQKKDKPESLKITYYSGFQAFPEWLRLDLKQGQITWAKRSTALIVMTAQEAYDKRANILRPVSILIDTNDKYPKLLDFRYTK